MSILRYLYDSTWTYSDIENAVDEYIRACKDHNNVYFGRNYLYAFIYGMLGRRCWAFVSRHQFYVGIYSDYGDHYNSKDYNTEVVMFMGNFGILCWKWYDNDDWRLLDCPGSLVGFDIL